MKERIVDNLKSFALSAAAGRWTGKDGEFLWPAGRPDRVAARERSSGFPAT